MATMGELTRAAGLVGVTSTTLRQHGWRTASPVRIQAVLDNPPVWLTIAREHHGKRRAKRHTRSVHRSTADRLDVGVGVVRERGINLAEVADLLAAPPEWLVIAQQRRRAHRERERADAQRRAVREAHELDVAEAYLRAVKDGGDTDAWAAGVLHAARIHRIDLGDGDIVPVLAPALKVVR
jgi:hypothetical protein